MRVVNKMTSINIVEKETILSLQYLKDSTKTLQLLGDHGDRS